MEKVFITFGGPTQNYHDAVNRLCNQAKSFGMFDKIIGYTEQDLKKHPEFYEKHNEFIKNNLRGYGFWIWKPYLILKTLEQMNDGDVLLYCDCGCELNINGKDRMTGIFKKMNTGIIFGSPAPSNDLNYTKMDLIELFGLKDALKILEKPQMAAYVFLIKKCAVTVNFFKEAYDICSNNYNLIDDSESISTNYADFIENRHDQSVVSLLAKKRKLVNYDIGRTYFGPSWTAGEYFPIWASRNKTGISIIPDNFVGKKINSRKILNKIESKRGDKNLFYDVIILIKDAAFFFYDAFIKF